MGRVRAWSEPVPKAMTKVAVVGAGTWGTAVAAIVSAKADVVLWARDANLAAHIDAAHENPRYLPGITLPPGVRATADVTEAVHGASAVVVAVPSHGFRSVLERAAPSIGPDVTTVSLTKGLEQNTDLRMTQVLGEVLPSHDPHRSAVLTGPNLALEVATGQPAASVVACADEGVAAELQGLFMTSTFRVYTNPDVIGCEIAGVVKNVMAIAAGAVAGLGFGDNARAGLITRGLAELTRLGVALGGNPLTFSGLAGMGDLVATCTSEQSRNRHVGKELGRGRPLDEILAEMSTVAEGVRSAPAVLHLAKSQGVDMPITSLVGAVLAEGRCRPADLVPMLMQREAKSELHGIR